ncbi:BLUF domain-containing protein [Hymenobacter cellulosivorans]|uniref:BLUF domain-containing protein n=1 Tax=Hymenobacter cellulosivorans TaxID=2932249 RepID=A0ABY4FA67_9BACT|nr:BLUF domain-containing protein [Hymenobacter cellulosivorans]UOQ53398.1 BLUF domain-containing protein [Hymenobacter cellulosivorans]
MKYSVLYTEAQRQRAVAWAVALTANTPLTPRRYEKQLLYQYQRGMLTLQEVLHRLDTSIYQILYRSQTVQPLTHEGLQEILYYSQQYNAEHQITGLLLYSEGRFVQVLEGPEAEVRTLYARIQADTRHRQVVTVGEGPMPDRRFGEWTMGFGQVAASDIALVLEAEPDSQPVPDVNEQHLQTLLRAFGMAASSIAYI